MPQFSIQTQDIQGNFIVIKDKNIIKHALSVLRVKIAEELLLIDENCISYVAKVSDISKDKITAEIITKEKSNKKLNFTLDLVQCTLKTNATDMVVQKITELGVKNLYITPAKRSVPKYERKDIQSKIAKWQKITEESCKQCERADKPTVHYLENFYKLKELAENYDLVIACVERSNDKTLKDVVRNAQKHDKVLVIIGPEGGFDDKETEFLKSNFQAVKISNLIYRAETAAISALAGVIYEYEL